MSSAIHQREIKGIVLENDWNLVSHDSRDGFPLDVSWDENLSQINLRSRDCKTILN